MSTALRRNRKGSDEEIIRLNAIGLSLATIAETIQCHPTSITLRLKSLKIPAADTRRAFMEDIYSSLPTEFKTNLADVLLSASTSSKPKSIKDYVRELLIADMKSRTTPVANNDNPVLTDIQLPTEGFEPPHA